MTTQSGEAQNSRGLGRPSCVPQLTVPRSMLNTDGLSCEIGMHRLYGIFLKGFVDPGIHNHPVVKVSTFKAS